MKNYLSTWFYSEQAEDESFYPSVGGSSSSAEFQYVYWRCIYVFYRSALLTNRDVVTDYLFFTNVENLPTVDGVNFHDFFEENKIKVVNLPLSYRTPKDWYGAWRNQFYIFDVLKYLKGFPGNHLILDSDCVITKSLAPLYRELEKTQVLTLPIDYAPEREINGCSILAMREIYENFFGTEGENKAKKEQLLYMGGEFVAITSDAISELLTIFDEIWPKNYARYEQKQKKLNEEAHVLSVCYAKMGKANELGRSYTKRIWTDLNCDTVTPEDKNLAIWHLPAEKKFGFRDLFFYLKKSPKLGANPTESENLASATKPASAVNPASAAEADFSMNPAFSKEPAIAQEKLVKKSAHFMKLSVSKQMRKVNWYYRYGKLKLKKILGR